MHKWGGGAEGEGFIVHYRVVLFWITHRGIVFSGLSPPKALPGPEEGKNGVQRLVESQLMSRERKGNGVTHVSHPPQTQLAGKSLKPQETILRFLSWGQEAGGSVVGRGGTLTA